MIIHSIKALNKAIAVNILMSLVVMLSVSLVTVNMVYIKQKHHIELNNDQKISSSFDLFKSNLSEKLSIVANSNVFIDFLRSGKLTRKLLKSKFLFELEALNSNEISGVNIVNSENELIFKQGSKTNYPISL